jgi:peptidoglycan/xylan/chitin deacetylase (PgdA/CDA1 family)
VKHQLKMALREAYARLLYHTGLHAMVDRLVPRRLVILAGHCVAPEGAPHPGGEHLPADMKIRAGRLRAMLEWFARRYRVVTVADGVAALDRGPLQRSLIAFSFDDGYRDNHAVLLPLLRETGTTATVFLESRPLDERRLSWTHKLFWLLARMPLAEFVAAYGEHAGDDPTFLLSNQLVAEGRSERPAYHVKRFLKYEGDPDVRDRAVDAVFAARGGDERALCEELYMSWQEARELQQAGVELGGHTVGHPILSRLPAPEQEREVGQGAAALRRELGAEVPTFAYPWGRRWDFDDASREAVRKAGFRAAVTMHAGANLPGSDRLALRRLAIDDEARMHLLVAEACGGFELLRRVGLDLSE